MRTPRNLLLAGAASLAIAGFSGMAHAGTPTRQVLKTHVLTLQLPRGVAEQIIHTGNVAPAVRLGPLPAASMPAFAEFPAFFGPGAYGFSVLARMNGRGVCSEGYRITMNGNGQTRVVPFHSGDCGPPQATRSASPTISPKARSRAAPRVHTVLASARTDGAPLQQVPWSR